MIQAFIEAVGLWITGMVSWLGSIFTGITQLFFVSSETGNGEFTFLGLLMLFGLAVGLVYFGIQFVVKLIKK